MKLLIALTIALASLPQDPTVAADLLKAGLAERKNDWRGALVLYRKYLQIPNGRDEATLGELRCLTALSDFVGLKRRSAEILSAAQARPAFSPRVLIAATTARGDVQAGAGEIKEALLDYLRGAWVLGAGEPSPEHEASVARGALACLKISAAQPDPARKALFRARSRELLEELLRSYPQSSHKKEIEQALR